MPDLTVGQAVERLSQIACRVHVTVLTRALRLALGQRRFTDLVLAAQHHLLSKDIEKVVVSYSATLDRLEIEYMFDRYKLVKERMNEAT